MSQNNILSLDNLTTIAQGAISGLTFGIYGQYISNKKMEINNNKMDKQMQEYKEEYMKEHDKQMAEIRELIAKIK